MEKCLENFCETMGDIHALLDLLPMDVKRDKKALVVYRSAVVLMVAAWEQYVEQLAERSVSILTARLRDSSPVPEVVKQKIALFAVKEGRSNVREFSNSVWQFSETGWKEIYLQFCKSSTSGLNTASPAKIKDLYWDILGIRDVTSAWSYKGLSPDECLTGMDNLVDLRHDIAHGANRRSDELTKEHIRGQAEFVTTIAEATYKAVFDHTAELSCKQAISYPLTPSCYIEIIDLAMKKDDRVLTLQEIKSLGSSAQGNHNKLYYAPWGLLEEIDKKTRQITDRLVQFASGKLALPLEILVFDNGDAIPAPNAPDVWISDLLGPKIPKKAKRKRTL